MNSTVNLFMCGNSAVSDGLVLTVLSVVKYCSSPIRLFVGTMDLSELSPRYTPISEELTALLDELLKEGNSESEALLVDLGQEFKDELINSKNIDTAYTPYAMLRLVADKIACLPDKIIYLDTDVLLHGDIKELFDVDVSDYHFAAARDYYGRWFIHRNYLNSGVMLWNLAAMRDDGVLAECRKMCRDKKMLLCDQSALNKCAKKKLILPDRFNEQHRTKEDTLIRHFSMSIRWFPYFRTEKIKPWQPELLRGRLGLYCYDDIILRWQSLMGISAEEKEGQRI